MIHNKNYGIFNVPRNDLERNSVSFLFRETAFWEDNKEDVNRCSSTLDIYFMRQTLAVYIGTATKRSIMWRKRHLTVTKPSCTHTVVEVTKHKSYKT
jgi:hypothetical protein